ncbi:patatin-like phospholipase family protein [Geodermatophilus sp. SYSU D01105]
MSPADPGPRSAPAPQRVGMVIAGAGARGAYEAGALSVLVPRLAAAGVRPRVFVGTSAGAINATLLAAGAHLPADEQAAALLRVWRRIGPRDVFGPLLVSTPRTAGTWLAQRLGIGGVRLTGLVDTTPLSRTADAAVDWAQLRANVEGGDCQALAVVTTSGRTGRTVVFADLAPGRALPPADEDRALDYVAAPVGSPHVRASAAIPVVFPPVRVTEPPERAGWYLDGGVRLNAPLKPALDLGCDAVVVAATHPDSYAVDPGTAHHDRPDVDDALVMLLDAALVDRMVEDLRTLTRVNELVAAGGRGRSTGRPLSVVPHLFAGPPERATLSRLAADVYREHFTGLRGALRTLREPDLPLLAQLLGGDGPRRGDVLSYLLFDPEFIARAIALGQEHATAMFPDPPDTRVPWRTEPGPPPAGPAAPGGPAADAGTGDAGPVPAPRPARAGAPTRPGGAP